MRRQEVLRTESPTQLWLMVAQHVLEAPVGGPEVMRGQDQNTLDVLILLFASSDGDMPVSLSRNPPAWWCQSLA